MSDELVTVASFLRQHEAEMARGFLFANDIDAFLKDEATCRIASHLAPIIGGIQLQVRPEDEAVARDLLAQVEGDHS